MTVDQPSQQALREKLRAYASSPEIREVRHPAALPRRERPPRADILDTFVPPAFQLWARAELPRVGRLFEGPRSPPARRMGCVDVSDPTPRFLSLREVFAKQRSVVVWGHLGSGKTALIRWLAVVAAEGSASVEASLGVSERLLPLPVSVGRLAELRGTWSGELPSVLAALARYFHERGVGDEGPLRALLERELEQGGCLALFDGLDEAPIREREAVRRWIESFAAAYPTNRFVVSSRFADAEGVNLPSGVDAALFPFEAGSSHRRYVSAHLRALDGLAGAPLSDADADAEAEELLAVLKADPKLTGLAASPLTLAVAALAHRSAGPLPLHRVQMYEALARSLCEAWPRERRLVAGAAPGHGIAYADEALPILGQLALKMHDEHPTGVAPASFVLRAMADALQNSKGISSEGADLAARELFARSALEAQILCERASGEWMFLAPALQGFFAVARLHQAGRFEEEVVRRLFDPRWEELKRLGMSYMVLVEERHPEALRLLERVLMWEEPEPRSWMTRVLGKHVEVVALLAAEARGALSRALSQRIVRELSAWAVTNVRESSSAVKACLQAAGLAGLGEEVASALEEPLCSEDPDRRLRVAQVLMSLPTRAAVPRLRSVVSSGAAPQLRERVLSLLRNERHPALAELTGESLPEPDAGGLHLHASVWIPPALALSSHEHVEEVIAMLARADIDRKNKLFIGNRLMQAPPNVISIDALESRLRRMLQGEEESARIGALLALASMRSGWAMEVIQSAAADPSPQVRAAATLVLTARVRGSERTRAALEALQTSDADVRCAALESLGWLPGGLPPEMPSPELLSAVIERALGDDAAIVRAEAVRVLQMPYPPVAVGVLGMLNQPTAFDALFAALHDPDAVVRRAAVSARLQADARGQEALLAALDDEDPGVRDMAVRVLEKLDSPAVITRIAALAPASCIARAALWNIAARELNKR